MSDRQVVVIGAGPAGLASAAELARAGVPAVVLERADAIGASWRGRYDRLRLNTSRLTSKLPHARYARAAGMFPSRNDMVGYLEDYAERNALDVRLGTRVDRVDRDDGGWIVRTSQGDVPAWQVIVATGYEHTPVIPDWPGRDRFGGRILHAADYRNAEAFHGADVLVVGPGCSGMEIAYDLAEGGAKRVRVAMRTPPHVVLRSDHGMPGDPIAIALLHLPTRIADGVARRMALVKLEEHGIPVPEEGLFARLRREGKAPAIVDKEVVDAVKERRIEMVAGVEALDERGVRLADGSHVAADAVIAATGYRRGLEAMVGHLGVLDERGIPRAFAEAEAAPGLRFVGYVARPGAIGYMGGEAKRAAKAIARELSRAPVAAVS